MAKEKNETKLNNEKAENTAAEEAVADTEEKVEEVEKDSEEKQPETEENQEDSSDDSIQDQLNEAKDKYLRIYSEFENFRRRTAKERLDLINTASREVMESLIPVLDDFERAIKNQEKDDEGIALIYNKFKKALTDQGLKEMGTKEGDEFDDEFHEAVTQIPAPKKSLEGKIVDVIEPGYFLGEKVIRFAKVVTGAKA
eukprot:gnl/MRDRNA2_/MRDRNA2_25449_c0_seq1.p1 gnl/MRDRNA2_/MRDRNA2_25449_c0~~gnl/MRDRNA2_/MRDRNA2_25449_c0_seq1.p1  ORF type:complete len:198 (+),score=55.28 gnl/MRDRNA2_/MRDRNA2_25449_c0_seq1:30-623(+)